MEPTVLLPVSEGRRAALKNSSPSTGFDPANLGSNGKHPNHYTTEDNFDPSNWARVSSSKMADCML
jgi:hypothetical protein